MAFRGLFIGIDRYQSPQIGWLSCAKRDAQALGSLFEDTFGGEATLLADEEATRANIKKAFQSLTKCDPDDDVVISFSGHGSDTHELVTHDADINDLASSAISFDVLAEWFSQIPAKNVVLLLDCCFSGGMGSKVLHAPAAPRDLPSSVAHLAKIAGEGRIVFTASGANEPAWESHKYNHGVFTHALLEALQGAEEVKEGGRLPLYSLLEYVTKRVSAFATAVGHEQTPTLQGTVNGTVTWPICVPGARFTALFPEFTSAKATSDLSSLAAFGFSAPLIAAWGQAIPSLNELQVTAINDFGLLRGEHLVVSAPTSSGKTMVGELAALQAIGMRRRAIFLLPLKALVADKARHFESVYDAYGVRTVEATGETDDISDLLRGRYDIALLTYEKFASIALTFPHVIEQAGVIVVDETQVLADKSRGANLEFLMTLIRMRRRDGVEPQVICLSAVIGDMNGFDSWLSARALIRTERPVPLDEGLLLYDGSFRYRDGEDHNEKRMSPFVTPAYTGKHSSQNLIIPLAQKLTGEGQQIIVFRATKGDTRGCAGYLAGQLGLPAATRALELLPAGDESIALAELREALEHGVCFHNADLSPEQRRIIEEEFRRQDSQIRVIVATTTLAMGVNTPASSVIIAGLDHPDTPYTVAEYKNLVGRAGRLGHVEHGSSFLIALEAKDEHHYWGHYVNGSVEDLHSRFFEQATDIRSLIVKVLVAVGTASSVDISADQIADFLESSFGAFVQKRISGGWTLERSEIMDALNDLVSNELVQSENGGYTLTPLGRLAGETGTEVLSIIRLVECLRPLSAAELTDPALIVAVQTTRELDQVLFPINKKSTQAEPATWSAELRGQGIGSSLLGQLSRHVTEAVQGTLRAKKAAACLLYISGNEMIEIERMLTKHGGAFGGAAGPIRSVALRTCDLLPTAARVAEILHPGLDFGRRINRLAIRLTYGISGELVDLAREAGGQLNRGDYRRLLENGLSDIDSINNADDVTILACVDNDKVRLNAIREGLKAASVRTDDSGFDHTPLLKPYQS